MTQDRREYLLDRCNLICTEYHVSDEVRQMAKQVETTILENNTAETIEKQYMNLQFKIVDEILHRE